MDDNDEANLSNSIKSALSAIMNVSSEALSTPAFTAISEMASALPSSDEMKRITDSTLPALDSISKITSSLKDIDIVLPSPETMASLQQAFNSTSSFSYNAKQVFEPIQNFQNENLAPIMKNLAPVIEEVSKFQNSFQKNSTLDINTTKIVESLKSFPMLQDGMNSHSSHEQEPFQRSVSNDEIDNWIQDAHYIDNLNKAFISFQIARERFFDFLQNPPPYITKAKEILTTNNYNNAFAYLISLLAYIDPILPFLVFTAMGTLGFLFPKPKEPTQPPNSQSEESD